MKWKYLFLFLLITQSGLLPADVLDIAHRGYAAVNPESTMDALKSAHKQGTDGFEIDVRQTRDNVLVVTHDATVASLGNRLVEDLTFAEIYLETDIASLEEMLIYTKQVDQTIWIEIKQSQRYPNIIRNVLNLISKYQLEASTVIQSFNHQDLTIIDSLNLEVRLLALFVNNYSLEKVPSVADFVGLPMINRYLNAGLVADLHRAGKKIIYWRKDNNSEIASVVNQFIAVGADGFMLDRPLGDIIIK